MTLVLAIDLVGYVLGRFLVGTGIFYTEGAI
jgi:hypothetical protein